MPQWSNTIPDDPRGHALPILRTPVGRPVVAIVTSPDLIGTRTHWWKGRTLPHEETNCEACLSGMPHRWHSYLSAYDDQKSLHFIFETTAVGSKPFIEYREAYGTLRGCLFEARRLNNKPNGRILLRTKPAELAKLVLPQPPDLIACLSIIWNLPLADLTTPRVHPELKTRRVRYEPATTNPMTPERLQAQCEEILRDSTSGNGRDRS